LGAKRHVYLYEDAHFHTEKHALLHTKNSPLAHLKTIANFACSSTSFMLFDFAADLSRAFSYRDLEKQIQDQQVSKFCNRTCSTFLFVFMYQKQRFRETGDHQKVL